MKRLVVVVVKIAHIITRHFLIVNSRLQYILAIECKRSLTGKAICDKTKGCLAQLERVKERLEIYLGDDISASWRFVGMINFEEDLEPDGRAVCSLCAPFTMKGDKEVSPKLAAVEADLAKQCSSPSHEEYKKIVRTLLFLISAKPTPTPCLLQKEVFSKIICNSN